MPKGKSKMGKSGKKSKEGNAVKLTDTTVEESPNPVGNQDENQVLSPGKETKQGLISRIFKTTSPPSSQRAGPTVEESPKGRSKSHSVGQESQEEKLPGQVGRSHDSSSVETAGISEKSTTSEDHSETKGTVPEGSTTTSKQLLSPSQKESQKKKRKQKKTESQKGQTVIDEFFQRRRSNRRNKSELEEEKQKKLEEAILHEKEDGLEVREVEGKGRGVFSTKIFEKGKFICEYAGELVDYQTAKEREKIYEDKPVGCYMYYFEFKNKKYCVDATKETGRLGRLLNHSKTGNCTTKVVSIKDTPHLILIAAKNIKVGEELLYDYGERSKLILQSHPWLKS